MDLPFSSPVAANKNRYIILAFSEHRPSCYNQAGLFYILSPAIKGGDSIGLSKMPLMAAVICRYPTASRSTHAVSGVSPRAACQGGELNGKAKWLNS